MRAFHRVFLISILLVAIAALLVTPHSTAKTKSPEAKALIEKLDQCKARAQLITLDMEGRLSAESGQARYRQLREMSMAVGEVAKSVQEMGEAADEMLQNDALARNPEIERDLRGVQTQLDYLSRSLENTLQYLEHLSYKFGQSS